MSDQVETLTWETSDQTTRFSPKSHFVQDITASPTEDLERSAPVSLFVLNTTEERLFSLFSASNFFGQGERDYKSLTDRGFSFFGQSAKDVQRIFDQSSSDQNQVQDRQHPTPITICYLSTNESGFDLVSENDELFISLAVDDLQVFGADALDLEIFKQDQALPQVGNDAVITAVIDDQFGFLNERFRDGPTSTRVASVFFLDKVRKDDGQLFVGQLTKGQIDKALSDADGNEREAYRALGVTATPEGYDFELAETSHGTHVLDLAAGCDPDYIRNDGTTMVDNPIILVNLPRASIARTNGAAMDAHIQCALDLIRRTASKMSEGVGSRPVVVNLSYGNYSSRHNGTAGLEMLLDRAIRDPISAIVVPAGNSLQSQCHAEIEFSDLITEGPQSVDFAVPRSNASSSFVQAWVPVQTENNEPTQFSLELIAPHSLFVDVPSATLSLSLDQASTSELRFGNDLLARVYTQSADGHPDGGTAGEVLVTVAIGPTTAEHSNREIGNALSGLWQLRLTMQKEGVPMNNLEAHKVRLWIERGDSLPGFPTLGEQTRFVDASYTFFDENGSDVQDDPTQPRSVIRRSETLNGFGTGAKTTVVAAIQADTDELLPYSSRGDGGTFEPTREEKGAESSFQTGLKATGTYSGTIRYAGGTSMASAVATRKLVLKACEMPNGEA